MRKHKKIDYSIIVAIALLGFLLLLTIGLGCILSKYQKETDNTNQNTIEFEYTTKTVDITFKY